VTRIAEENALDMLGQGHLGTLTSWLESLPEEIACTRPWLCVAHGWLAVYAGRLEATGGWLKQAEEQLGQQAAGQTADEGQHIAGHIAVIRAYTAGLGGAYERFESNRDGNHEIYVMNSDGPWTRGKRSWRSHASGG
jgi:ATP/maltotriose-dependent transcriptional regulator MalT